MIERPILFSTPMIQAILDGKKTMTRRVVKFNDTGRVKLRHKNWHIEDENVVLGCPYGQVGDSLWVRETFVKDADHNIHYKADSIPPWKDTKWKPSIFMPRWASRITLEITNIRVERLQEITEEDAIKEGMKPNKFENGFGQIYPSGGKTPHKRAFAILWDSINGDKHPWASNPWVWCIEFQRIK
jgi:hypothetical protein